VKVHTFQKSLSTGIRKHAPLSLCIHQISIDPQLHVLYGIWAFQMLIHQSQLFYLLLLNVILKFYSDITYYYILKAIPTNFFMMFIHHPINPIENNLDNTAIC